ncbi:hypothetical protein QBC42DRAFT_316433 [Cladorrhinum samala]|uniref:Uncharacterized protein n=1 Tax=Cladorrhinum samala TaxID=585594 RepID=A0AAV9HCQ3_9PEZI|nr:hypothetical protein QBC42DRAFT_316433 [Cladorrhinum samala]
MCFQEFIAYQCAHRSVTVVRPCPLTTTGHNFPVCQNQPVKQHFATTMCAPCEREMHSRWVLIREWEHHWLHDRGACGCNVKFPTPYAAPRTVGGNDKTLVGGKGKEAESRIPPLFQESVTESGERHVEIRLPGQYAVEWLTDHRRLHEQGRCMCNTGFGSVIPLIPEEAIGSTARVTLFGWRRMEDDITVARSQRTGQQIIDTTPIAANDSAILAARARPTASAPTLPAYPSYATAETYTDSIPAGAIPWATTAEILTSQPHVSAGPGPYRTPGLDYSWPSVAGHHPNPDPHRVADAPRQIICGVPIGAGPEGLESHMPSWGHCSLRRSEACQTRKTRKTYNTSSDNNTTESYNNFMYEADVEAGGSNVQGCGGSGGRRHSYST